MDMTVLLVTDLFSVWTVLLEEEDFSGELESSSFVQDLPGLPQSQPTSCFLTLQQSTVVLSAPMTECTGLSPATG